MADVVDGLMKFELIDRIIELETGQRIVATKAVSRSEEYLADHFPTFPVLPGVFMLEGLIQAASWLIRDALNFAPAAVLLKSARNVTYKSFVKPGDVLRLEVNCRSYDEAESSFDGIGKCGEVETLRARFTMCHLSEDAIVANHEATEVWREASRVKLGALRHG